jgi:DNA mismatch repair protein MSH6
MERVFPSQVRPSSLLFPNHFSTFLFCSVLCFLLLTFRYRFPIHLGRLINMGKPKDAVNATPARPPLVKKQTSSAGSQSGQRSIASFFSKAPAPGTPHSSNGVLKANETSKAVNAMAKPNVPVKKPAFKKTAVKSMTPVASSDAIGPSSSQENENGGIPEEVEDTGLPSPLTPAKRVQQVVNGNGLVFGSSPSRKVSSHPLHT